MQGKFILETERLILREMTKDDVLALQDFLGDAEVMYAYEHGFDKEEIYDWYRNNRRRYEEDGFGLWAVIRKADGRLIGDCGLTMQDFGSYGVKEEIGYHLAKDCWHQGYAAEAAKAVRDYAFYTLDIPEVWSVIRDNNIPSKKVALRNGMKKCGELVKHYRGIDMPHELYSVRRTPYDTIFLDLDGTLIDSEKGIINSVLYALEKFGKTAEREELLPFIGPPLIESFQVVSNLTPKDARQAVGYYRENFGVRGVYEYSLYDGIRKFLAALKAGGKRIVMATSKPEIYARMIADDAGITEYFDFICGSDMEGKRLTKEDVIAYALEKCGLLKGTQRVLMIGDRKHDILGAKAFALKSAGVLYGFGTKEELERHGADYLFASVREAQEYLE